jgi:adenylate cyclase
VFTSGEGLVIDDAYADERFNKGIDEKTGFTTRNLVCAPIRTALGDIIGAAEMLNKRDGPFTAEDLELLAAMTTQGSLAIQSAQSFERMKAIREQELEFMKVVTEISSELKINSLLQKVMDEATRMLNAERSTLFLNDEKSNELWSEVGQGLKAMQIRIPTTRASPAPSSHRQDHQHSLRLRRPALQPGGGPPDRLLHALDPVRAGREPARQDHRRHAGAQQARRPLHARGRVAPQGLHGADLDRARERQALRRRGDDEELQREHARVDVERRAHAGRRGTIATCNAAGQRILRHRGNEIINKPAADFFVGPTPGSWTS